MDAVQHQTVVDHLDVQFWPVEHPMEPQDEDRPVKCPIPTSSVINDGRSSTESFGKRGGEVSAAGMKKEGNNVVVGATADHPPARAVRKRHHTLTRGGDRVMIPSSTRMNSSFPRSMPNQNNVTIFQMLQQFHKFES